MCKKVGMTRQNFYKRRKFRKRKKVDELLIKALIEAERSIQPRLGGLKLYNMLRSELRRAGVHLGRDRFFKVLSDNNLLLSPRPKVVKTTNSNHSLPVFSNLIKDYKLTSSNEIWVSDITYIRISDSFSYLSLITDKYSRKIVGWSFNRTMEVKGVISALNMAISELPEGVHPIHHSDRGSQYCSHAYVNCLNEHGLPVSMTEDNHCAENALAERVNGILKQEYFLDACFHSFDNALKAVKEAITLYNNRRPHRSLKMSTPAQVHNKVA